MLLLALPLAHMTFAHAILAADINLDRPKFKAEDCVVWTPPMNPSSAVVKIKKLNSLTFRGETVYTYEIEAGTEVLSIQTWQFDMGKTDKFKCSDFQKIKSQVEASNKTIKDAQKLLETAKLESEDLFSEHDAKRDKVVDEYHRCNNGLAHYRKDNDPYRIACVEERDAQLSEIKADEEIVFRKFKSKYPSLNINQFYDGQYGHAHITVSE